jgi:hypothetical protein
MRQGALIVLSRDVPSFQSQYSINRERRKRTITIAKIARSMIARMAMIRLANRVPSVWRSRSPAKESGTVMNTRSSALIEASTTESSAQSTPDHRAEVA